MILPETATPSAPLVRGIGLWQATAINITQIVGAGVFATVPLILGVLPGAYALLAWLVAGMLIICDGMVWGELGAALPSSGGSYNFLLHAYGRRTFGRLMAFLFVWQILLSGPLEVGSGLVAAAQFSTAVSPAFNEFDRRYTREVSIDISDGKTLGIAVSPSRAFGFALGVLIVALLYRRVTTLGRLSVFFLVCILALIGWVLLEGAIRFDPTLAFDTSVPPADPGLAIGAGMGFAIYSYLGYYNVCYLGDEVRNPGKTIPRAILLSAAIVIVLFCLVQLAFTGVIPWREAAAETNNLTALFMTRTRGDWAGTMVTIALVGSCFVSAFSGALGYSRVPYAAARDGNFFRWFAEVHPRLHIPHRSVLLIGGLVLFWSFFNLSALIEALIATRILEQFVAQVFAVVLLRRLQPDRPRPWKMYLYPLPAAIALVGWIFVYISTGRVFVLLGAGTLVVGLAVYLLWARQRGEWPFNPPPAADEP